MLAVTADEREDLGIGQNILGFSGVAETAIEIAGFQRRDIDGFGYCRPTERDL